MKRMNYDTPGLTSSNIDKIAALFPSCITESRDANGHIKKAVSFELLRQLLSEDITDGTEAYGLGWVGKKAAIADANRSTDKQMCPCPEESLNWED
ncbi:site-specific DNA-methyltransferase, partial [bacterium]|nr:site-specific DNA-methyltransferase [bacterium]